MKLVICGIERSSMRIVDNDIDWNLCTGCRYFKYNNYFRPRCTKRKVKTIYRLVDVMFIYRHSYDKGVSGTGLTACDEFRLDEY